MEAQLAKRKKLLNLVTTISISYARNQEVLFLTIDIKKTLFVNSQYEFVKVIF